MQKKLILWFFILCLALLPSQILFAQENETGKEAIEIPSELNNLYAQSAVLMDADSGRILFSKKGQDVLAMASTTKIMTCIIALENGKMDDVVTISEYAARQPKVHLGMSKNQQYYLQDLLYSLMLQSHNDSAVAIAEHIGGSVEGFASLMNQKAQDLGCKQTNFVTPNGLDALGHQTTAEELAKIAQYAIQNEQFLSITNTAAWNFSELTAGTQKAVHNANAFLGQMDGAIGIKTGFTGKAGYCFVGAIRRDGKSFISVVLASGWPPNRTYKWSDTQKLMNYALTHYQYKQVLEPIKTYQQFFVKNGQEKYTDTYIDAELNLLLSEDDQVELIYDTPRQLEAPVQKGEKIGVLSVKINGKVYVEYPICVDRDILKIDYPYCVKNILEKLAP
ncbi:D-alanyl-D-alanine carboxypeptidase [Clostridia bacterium]|nr:D-alanyl-D-alanine carboxypeptidase [Clostridia bacterium]